MKKIYSNIQFILKKGKLINNSLIMVLMCLFAFFNQVEAQFSSGTGTLADPYQITTPADLNNVRNYLGAGIYFKQMNDIDLTAYLMNGGAGYAAWGTSGWQPIGNDTTNFSGSYDGNKFTISGIFINRTSQLGWIGLFGATKSGSTIKNLGVLIRGSINGQNNVGALVGWNNSNVTSCYSTGVVNGTANNVGGLIGGNDIGGSISNSYSSAVVTTTGAWACGGHTGVNYGAISNCYATGAVKGVNEVAGFVGITSGGSLTNCYATGHVTASGYYGGINGYAGPVTNSYWDINTTGQSTSVGSVAATYGKTTADMKIQATYTGWDFTVTPIWKINANTNNGYPFLAWQIPPQSITFAALNAVTYGDSPFTISATGGASGNPVIFTSSDVTIATCTGTNGATVTILKAGSCDIIASQAGDGNTYGTASQVSQTPTINKKALTITPDASQSKLKGQADPVLTYTVTFGSLITGDHFTGSLSRQSGDTVGMYPIVIGTLAVGSNYIISLVPVNFKINLNTAVNTIMKNNPIVSPNPTSGLVTLNTPQGNVTVLDMAGKVIIETSLDKNKTIDLSGYATGTYILILKTNDALYQYKIIKK